MAYLTYLLPALMLAGLFVGLCIALIVAERLLVNYGVCQIVVDGGEQTLEVDGGQSLLSALLDAKINVPNACAGKGSCGYCKVTVLEGGGQVLPTETPYLSRKEVRSNVRLACQVKVRSDMDVKLVDFLETVRSMVENKTYNPDLKWNWKVGRPAQRPAETEEPAEEEELGEEERALIDGMILEQSTVERGPRGGTLIAVLQAINSHYRYLPANALRHVSKALDVPLSRICGLATFYNSFSLTPKGKCTVKVCLGTACHVKGAARLLERLEREMGIKEAETTPDLEYTLEGVRCLGCCGLAPVITFEDEVHGSVKPAQVPKLLEAHRGEPVNA
ncbi:MAG: NAD(P)H-dependent oxidoreductase subunit E [Planctomycetota bacterium]